MITLAILFALSFTLSFLLTPLCRNAAVRLNLVDHPDHGRKVHKDPLPRVGGVPILIAYLGASLLLFASPHYGGFHATKALPIIWGVLPAALIVFFTGLLDDVIGLAPWQKLSAQLIAASVVCWAGVRIAAIAGHRIESWWAIPITILWLVGCTNAVNLIDGVDGLAAGVGLFGTLTTLMAALIQGNLALALATAPLAGALFGFLRYNFNPATIFLGDSGSLTVGFLLGCYGVIWSQKAATALGMTAPLMAFSIPLLDTGLAIARRVLRGQPIFGADRRHIHHVLLDRGLNPRRVAFVLYAMCGVAATLSILQSLGERSYGGLIILLFCAAAWVGIQHLGYVEFNLAGRLINPGTFQRVLDAQMKLQVLGKSLDSAATPDECWSIVRRASLDLGFTQVSMRLDHSFFDYPAAQPKGSECWTLSIPLSETEFVKVAHPFERTISPMVVGGFADLLKKTIEPKLTAFRQSGRCEPSTKATHSGA